MKKKTGNKFLKGAVVGAALGVAAGLLASSKEGKKVKKEVKEKLGDFYAVMAPKLKKAKEVGEKEYKFFINKALADYNKDGKFNKEDLKHLAKEAQKSWKHIKKHLSEDQ